MRIYRTQESFEQAERRLKLLETKGFAFQRLTAKQVVELELASAAVRDELTGGFYFPHDEVGDCHKFTWKGANDTQTLSQRLEVYRDIA
jgi:D-amino-acid dehydrogenase